MTVLPLKVSTKIYMPRLEDAKSGFLLNIIREGTTIVQLLTSDHELLVGRNSAMG
jgi:hypothetical protein